VLTFPRKGDVESALIQALLAGDDSILACLREQLDVATLVERDLTGSGFFLKFAVPTTALPADPANVVIDDVLFELEGLEHGGGAIAHDHGGYLNLIEAYLNAETWPTTPVLRRVYYDTGDTRNLDLLRKVWRDQGISRSP
jgi:hypothetical protein